MYMVQEPPHPWDVTFKEAVQIQKELAHRVSLRTPVKIQQRLQAPELLIAAADISYNRRSPLLFAVVVVMRLGDFEVIERVSHCMKVTFPYVSGFLSFREAPVVIEAFKQLECRPDVLLCDGQGRAHPRRLGLASHLGVLLNLPSIGCAKTRLTGTYREPGAKKGATTRLTDREEVIGRVVRTRSGVKPIYVSVGHKIDLDDAVRLVLRCCPRYRIPEPIRQAHMIVNQVREASS